MELDDQDFLKEKKQIEKLPDFEQKAFYIQWLGVHTEKTTARVTALFCYASILYREGDFRKVMEVLMPVVMNYQSYPNSPELVSCCNQMGLAVNCEAEYDLARHYFQLALEAAEKQNLESVYSKLHNNIGLTYYDQNELEAADREYAQAEKWIAQSINKEWIAPMVYGNWANTMLKQKRWADAIESTNLALAYLDPKNAAEVAEDEEVISLYMIAYYKLGRKEQYEECREKLLAIEKRQGLGIVTIRQLLEEEIGIEDEDFLSALYRGVDRIFHMSAQSNDWISILICTEIKYAHAKEKGDTKAALEALEQRVLAQTHRIDMLEKKRVETLMEYMDIANEKQKALEQAESATRAKTRFLSNMSHDIRTPMNAIFGITQLMEHDKTNLVKMEDHIQKLQVSSRYLLSLINDVLDMSKIESSEVCLNREEIYLPDLIAQLKSIMDPQTQEHHQTFVIHTDEMLYENLIGDAVRLRQVFLNLLSNAVKYTPDGGTITLDLTQKKQDKNHILLAFTVTDTGYGMTPDFVQHIFEPFTRAEDSTTNKIQGTGLGMAITKSIVDLMSGTITLQSEPGKGSSFFVTVLLEIAQTALVHSSTEKNDSQTAGTILQGMKFLCAEDNALNAEILEAILEMEGADCTIYPDGRQIVEAFAQVKPGEYDAILMDMQMPVMNGLEATAAIRNNKNQLGKTIPIIAMTANAFSSDVQACLDAGMNAHLSKPLEIELLKQTMRRISRPHKEQYE